MSEPSKYQNCMKFNSYPSRQRNPSIGKVEDTTERSVVIQSFPSVEEVRAVIDAAIEYGKSRDCHYIEYSDADNNQQELAEVKKHMTLQTHPTYKYRHPLYLIRLQEFFGVEE